MIRTYRELRHLPTLVERYNYLRLGGIVGDTTFGRERWVNQAFYRSREWRMIRDEVIARDLGYDLGAEDAPLPGTPYIHHMNPLTLEDIEFATDNLLNPDGLITVSHRTHNAIHYGDEKQLPRPFVERSPGDTLSWHR